MEEDKTYEIHQLTSVDKSLIFMCFIIFMSSVAQFFVSSIRRCVPIPYSVALFVLGLALGAAGKLESNFGQSVKLFAEIDAHIIFYVFLPPLLYETAAAMNWHVFRKILFSSVLLAIPGVFINILLLTGVLMYLLSLSFWEAALGGSILAATDPVATVTALASLGAPESLSHLIEGESLLNDGSAVVIFTIVQGILGINTGVEVIESTGQQFSMAIAHFCQLALGGPLMGCLFGIFLITCLRLNTRVNHSHARLEITLTGVALWGCFFLCEYIKISGVLGVVALGCVMSAVGNLEYSRQDTFHKVHIFLEQVSYFSIQSLFFIAGVVSWRYLFFVNDRSSAPVIPSWTGVHYADYDNPIPVLLLAMFGTYLAIHVTRFFVNFLFYPILRRVGYGLRRRDVVFCSLAGLRGAVGIALVLLLENNTRSDIQDSIDSGIPSVEDLQNKLHLYSVALRIAFVFGGIVLLTLLVNGTLTIWFFNVLKIDPVTDVAQDYLQKILISLDTAFDELIDPARPHESISTWFMNDVDLENILPAVPLFSEALDRFHGNTPIFRLSTSVQSQLHSLENQSMKSRKSELGPEGNEISSDELQWPTSDTFGKICDILLDKLNKEKSTKVKDVKMRTSPDTSFYGGKMSFPHLQSSFLSLNTIFPDHKDFPGGNLENMDPESRWAMQKLFCSFIFNISMKEYTKLLNYGFIGRRGFALLKEGIDLGMDILKTHDSSVNESSTHPIEVQFQHLTQVLSSPDLVEKRIFRIFERYTYRYRYRSLREKVQVLAAFIFVTDHVVESCCKIYQIDTLFPDLYDCLETEVELASEVYMKALAETSARRYFYVRQALGMRYLLNVKKRLVEDSIEEGKLNSSHGLGLLKVCIEKPLRQLDHFDLGPPPRQVFEAQRTSSPDSSFHRLSYT